MSEPETEQKPPESQIHKTDDKNRFLLVGELTDWVLLFNAGGRGTARSAKHSRRHRIRGARGECVYPPSSGRKDRGGTGRGYLEGLQGGHSSFGSIPLPRNQATKPGRADRNAWRIVETAAELLGALVRLSRGRHFSGAQDPNERRVEKSAKAWGVVTTEIENAILAGTREGYGLRVAATFELHQEKG